jgi:hypothetical protein
MAPALDVTGAAVAGAVVATLVADVALVAYVLAKRRAAAERSASSAGRPSTVACERCGAQNGPDYRFCRACAAEL